MEEYLQNIIEFLENKKNNDSSIIYFTKIYNKLLNDIFEILNYELPIPVEIKEDYDELIKTLNVLHNNKFVVLNGIQENAIINSEVYQHCLNYIKNKKIKGKTDEINELINEFKNLNGNTINDELINKFYDYLSKNKIDFREAEKACKSILLYNSKIHEKVTITEEELSELFEKYGYSYKKVPEKYKELLINEGSYYNIDSLFKKFKKYEIKFDEKKISYIYFLIKSDEEIFENIWQICQINEYDIKELIKKVPAIFLHKTTKEEQIVGTYEDLEKTIKLFDEIGYDFITIMENCRSILVKPYDTLKRNVDLLLEYGFSKNLAKAGFKLTAFKSNDILLTLDKFIELGELKYVKENTSRLALEPDSYVFYRLYYAKKYNKSNQDNEYIIKRQFSKKEVFTSIIYTKEETILDYYLNDKSSITNYVFDEKTDLEIKKFLNSFDYSSSEIYYDDVISKIEENKASELEYKFNDIIISRPKVIRVYSALASHYNYDKKQLLLYALTYNSILDNDEFNIIKSYIKGREK